MTNRCENIDRETARHSAKKVLKIIGFVILGIAAVVLFGFVVMWLWNWLMPEVFGLTTINYWQAVGIFILSKIFFGGISSSSDNSNHKQKRKMKGEFSKEFNKEFNKEFDKEFDKKNASHQQENKDYDEMYEKWWQEKGENSFDEFIKNQQPSD